MNIEKDLPSDEIKITVQVQLYRTISINEFLFTERFDSLVMVTNGCFEFHIWVWYSSISAR